MSNVHYHTCPLCEATCGLEIHTSGDEVVAIKPDKQDVFSRGYMCAKGPLVKEIHEDPDRVRTPLIRESDGSFRKASWKEAFELIDENISRIVRENGREALGVYLGNPSAHKYSLYFYNPYFIRALRTKSIFSASSVDQVPKMVSSGLMFGTSVSVPIPDINRTDYFLLIGANPYQSNGSLMTAPDVPGRIRDLKKRGGKFVVVDPRRTKTAQKADEHFFIRPGSDVFFLFGLLNSIFANDLVNPGRMAEHLLDLDKVKELAAEFTPEKAAAKCGIAAQDIERLAREVCEAKSAAVYGRMGTTTQEFGTVCSWLIDVINVLSGNLDEPGGVMFPLPLAAGPTTRPRGKNEKGVRLGRRTSRVSSAPQVFSELPAAVMSEEIETPGKGQVKALFTMAGNPVVSTPNAGRLQKALTGLEFMVSLDIYVNETTRHANVILPGLSPLEGSHYDWIFGPFMVENVGNYSPPVFAKSDDQLEEWEIILQLGSLLGGRGLVDDFSALDETVLRGWISQFKLDDKYQAMSDDDIVAALGERRGPDRILDYLLRIGPYGDAFGQNSGGLNLDELVKHPHGINKGNLTSRMPDFLRTASNKIELAPEILVEDVERVRSALVRNDEGLRLVGRRDIRSNNSWLHNVAAHARNNNDCTLHIHPDDAAQLGIKDGAEVRVSAKAGSLTVAAEITDTIMAGTVSLPHGWGHADEKTLSVASQKPGVNSNILTDETIYDAPSGNAILNGIPVEVGAA